MCHKTRNPKNDFVFHDSSSTNKHWLHFQSIVSPSDRVAPCLSLQALVEPRPDEGRRRGTVTVHRIGRLIYFRRNVEATEGVPAKFHDTRKGNPRGDPSLETVSGSAGRITTQPGKPLENRLITGHEGSARIVFQRYLGSNEHLNARRVIKGDSRKSFFSAADWGWASSFVSPFHASQPETKCIPRITGINGK